MQERKKSQVKKVITPAKPGLPLGQSAKAEEVINLARRHGPAAMEALADVMQNGTDAARIAAARELLDRGYGKVGQPIEVSGKGGGAIPLKVGLSPAIQEALTALRGMQK